MVVAPASMAAWKISTRNAGSDRVASWALNWTSAVYWRARATMATASLSTSASLIRSMCRRWMGEVEMNTWIRARSASRMASQARSTSLGSVRARAQMTGPRTSRAMAWTARNSPGEVMGKPASITSTFSRASCRAISSFSSGDRLTPGDCSPSRRVVSKKRTGRASLTGGSPPGPARCRPRRPRLLPRRARRMACRLAGQATASWPAARHPPPRWGGRRPGGPGR